METDKLKIEKVRELAAALNSSADIAEMFLVELKKIDKILDNQSEIDNINRERCIASKITN